MRFRLRTMLIVLALGPPVLAWVLFQSAVLTARYREHGRLNWRTVRGDVAGVKRLFTGERAPSLELDHEAIRHKVEQARGSPADEPAEIRSSVDWPPNMTPQKAWRK